MDCKKTTVPANTKVASVDSKQALKPEQDALRSKNASEQSAQGPVDNVTQKKSGFFNKFKSQKKNQAETKIVNQTESTAGVSDQTNAKSNDQKITQTSNQANEKADRDGPTEANVPLTFSRNRDALQKQIMELESKIECQSMRSSAAAPPEMADSEMSQDQQPFDRSSVVKNRSRNHPLDGKNQKNRKTMPAAHLASGTSGVDKPIFDASRSQCDILASNISIDNSIYMGGQNQKDDTKGALNNSFDEPMRKPQTCIQQPSNQERLDQQAPTSAIKIPSGELSQSADSPGPQVKTRISKTKQVPQQDLLINHRATYKKHCEKFREDYTTRNWDMEGIVDNMKSQKIKCVKYNYSLAAGVQNFFQFDGLITLSEDGKRLVLTLKKYNEKPIHVLEPDPHTVKKHRDQHKKKLSRNTILLKKSIKQKGESQDAEQVKQIFEEALPDVHSDHEVDYNEDLTQDQKDDQTLGEYDENVEVNRIKDRFQFTQSSTSCALTDIEGIIFGGFSSRFWIYRKHLSCLDANILMKDTKKRKFRDGKTELPFYSWQCITLQLKDRDVDLVIKDQRSMDLFIRFLVFAINTQDCRKDSAENFVKGSTLFEVKRRERELRKVARAKGQWTRQEIELTQEQKDAIEYRWRKKIYQQTVFKYNLMRIRAKIAYQAFQNKMSINELIIKQILESYTILKDSGSIPPCAKYSDEILSQFEVLLQPPGNEAEKPANDNADSSHENSNNTIVKLIKINLDPVLRARKDFLYQRAELKGFGCNDIEDLDPKQRAYFLKIYEANTDKTEVYDALSKENMIRTRDLCAKDPICKGAPGEDKGIAENPLFDKSKCVDVFNDVIVDDLQMYEQRSSRVKLQMKFKRMIWSAQLRQVKFMIGVGGLTDDFYLKAVIKKIELQKAMFVLELEQGQEVYIPNELSCDSYPQGFRFYDPIIQIVNHLFAGDNQVYHTLKTEFNLDKIKGSDWVKDLMIQVGILENPKKPQLFTKHQLVNERILNEIDHSQSHHSVALQKSRYLLIDSQEERLMDLASAQVFQTENAEDYEKYIYSVLPQQYKSIEDKQLNMRYCHNDEVTQKRQKFIKFKQTFYQRHDHLKNNGQKFHTVKKLQTFIYDNLEHLYAIRPRDLSYGQNVLAQDLDLIPLNQLTGRQLNLLYKDKQTYAEYLLTETEKKVMARRAHVRNTLVDTIYEECAPSIGYNQKNSYLEDRIEATNTYFNHLDDLNNKGAHMEKVKKELFKLNRELRRKDEEGVFVKLDPLEYLDQMRAEEEERLNPKKKKANSDDESEVASPLSLDDLSPLKTAQPTAEQLKVNSNQDSPEQQVEK